MIIIEELTDSSPRYHMRKEDAVIRHNMNGIRLWRKRKGCSHSVKAYATGDIPAWMQGYWYEEVPNPYAPVPTYYDLEQVSSGTHKVAIRRRSDDLILATGYGPTFEAACRAADESMEGAK